MFFFPAPLGSSGFNCSSTGTSNQSQFLKSHHDKQPQFITHQCRNLELNVHSCTNPTLYFRRSQRGGTITAGALCGLAYTFTFLFVRVPVWSHTSAPHPSTATWPPGRPPFPRCLPAVLHPFTFIAHSSVPPTARRLEVMTCVVLDRVGVVCLPAYFSLGYILLHKQLPSYIQDNPGWANQDGIYAVSAPAVAHTGVRREVLLCLLNKSICVAITDISGSP